MRAKHPTVNPPNLTHELIKNPRAAAADWWIWCNPTADAVLISSLSHQCIEREKEVRTCQETNPPTQSDWVSAEKAHTEVSTEKAHTLTKGQNTFITLGTSVHLKLSWLIFIQYLLTRSFLRFSWQLYSTSFVAFPCVFHISSFTYCKGHSPLKRPQTEQCYYQVVPLVLLATPL